MACLVSATTHDCELLHSLLNGSSLLPMGQSINSCCSFVGINCTNNSMISELRLGRRSLDGSIDISTIGALRELTYLDLSGNNLTGQIPEDVWNSSNLQHLDLSANDFSGVISSALWRLANLTYVNLSSNSFRGQINISKSPRPYPLRTLDLSGNQIGGFLSASLCSTFQNLFELNISSNRILSGNFSQCTNLSILNASFNNLSGAILADVFRVTSLTSLDLKQNDLSGNVPSLGGLKNLTFLDLSFNYLTGNFSQAVVDLPAKLLDLNVSYNNLTVFLDPIEIEKFGESAFLNNTEFKCMDCPSPSPSPSPAPSIVASSHFLASSKVLRVAVIAAVAVSCVLGLITIIVVWVILRKRKRRMKWVVSKPPFPFPLDKQLPETGPFSFEADSGTWVADVKDPTAVGVVIFEKPLLNLTFADLLQATSSFDKGAEVGDGCGLVYKCVLPGMLSGSIAIKVVEGGRNWKAEDAVQEFVSMGKMKHENLVPLLGYCIVGKEKLLIYKHMEGGSLEEVLHALPEGVLETEDWSLDTWEDQYVCNYKGSLNWDKRLRVALGTARALAYLHHGGSNVAVHGGVSGSNILLEEVEGAEIEARLANYGGGSWLRGVVSLEYTAPEVSGRAAKLATPKSDVYSFGVVLLELATGRRARGDYGQGCANLVAWIRQLRREKRGECAIDARLLGEGGPALIHVVELLNIAYLCTADCPTKRPAMQQVVGLLKDLAASSTTS